MIVIALLVPVALLLLMFALDALEDILFPASRNPPPDDPAPEQPVTDGTVGDPEPGTTD
ncbi:MULTISPECIES: hypothetical protein [Streptomyces]|uniref:hypothetical protein n=1 Tax=Streptomyces TaxID=1883 RepID=UPI0019269BC3|nr:hypothetical protein [Streptomyces sp. SID2888]